ncbi:hypothetical protein GQX73_g5952 [Xylaria multiplex]|uniref:Dihydroorotate dehydrogenase (fumarate) n=1 Tax=Xylaria multiplex TaxID=323545 RepID=A0A7C8IZZ8_9PEZI|nr:hypothetical protein GQX73_g5952 [Xylaria multiplex]
MSNDARGSGVLPPRLDIDPPLFNSANPWATTLEHLRDLYACAATGAVTTRTALLRHGFPHDEAVHRFRFFEAGTHRVVAGGAGAGDASLNTLGYSPLPLDEYLGFIRKIDEELGEEGAGKRRRKPFIVSVTGSPEEVAQCYRRIARCAWDVGMPLAMEVNLSCPNIPGKPPPAYDAEALKAYVRAVAPLAAGSAAMPWGLKTPPYTHAGEFEMLVAALRECAGAGVVAPLSFVTATNTLGSCLVFEGEGEGDDVPALGPGGVAGAPLHPLALGNVAALRRLLDQAPQTRHVQVLGVGGVADAAGYRRMRRVGAAAVGVGTGAWD